MNNSLNFSYPSHVFNITDFYSKLTAKNLPATFSAYNKLMIANLQSLIPDLALFREHYLENNNS